MRFGVSLRTATVLALSVLVSMGQGCTRGPDQAAVVASQRADIRIWGVSDDVDAYSDILADYRKVRPYVNIEYRRFRLEEYEEQLVNALAEDRGPDIFLIHNTWVTKYLPKISSMPASTKVAQQTVQGTVRKEVVYQLVNEPTVSLRKYKTDYPDVVAQDFVRRVNVSTASDKTDIQERVLGIPLSVDTLAMYVNKDLLNAAGVATIPETWDQFQAAVRRLVKLSPQGDILQAGAALGTGVNVERSPDIVSALMMQNGAEMTLPDGTPAFDRIPEALSDARDVPPSYQALQFYTDFANPGRDVYTWNNRQPNSLDAFIQGKTAFFFGYSYHLPVIKARAPRLNLAIAPFPQIQGNSVVNFANYWGWVVSKKSKNQDLAWNILNFMRTPEESKKFLDASGHPAALKSQLSDQLENEQVGVFASQVLTSKSWYRGNDPRAADAAFVTMIETALVGDPENLGDAIRTAAQVISQTIPYGSL